LQVLDARFIEETRNIGIEEQIKKQGKEIIYVLNKSDLVDKQQKLNHLKPYVYVSAKKRIGIKDLRNKIKALAKKIDMDGRERVHVGIIGYPNTGKSSLINILTGTSSAKTGAEAGFTKGMQKLRLTSDIVILDTPGVIPQIEYSHVNLDAIKKHAKVGARTIDKIKDPEIVVAELMKTNAKEIESYYGIDADGNSEVLVEEFGKKRKFLKKGGLVDEDRTCRLIITDWQEGRIRI